MSVTEDQIRDMEDTLRNVMRVATQTVQPAQMPDLAGPREPLRRNRPGRPGTARRTGGRMRSALVPLGAAAVVALIAVAASVLVPRGRPASQPRGGQPAASAARFFLALGPGNGNNLYAYSVATGRLVARIPPPARGTSIPVATATGSGQTFVVADARPNCGTTKLYRLTLTAQGQPGGWASLPVSPIRGTVTALAASANGSAIGYATQFCTQSSSAPGAIGLIHVRTGQTRQWSVPAPGQSITDLSMTASGDMLTYAGAPFEVTGPSAGETLPVRTIRLLPAGASPGPADQRSRVAVTLSQLSTDGFFSGAVLNPDGRMLYFCQTSDPGSAAGHDTLRGYDVRTGTLSVLRSFGRGEPCAVGMSGHYLLAGSGGPGATLIRYDLSTGRSALAPTPDRWAEVTGTIPW
jgi:hypothetical protein